MGDVVPHGLDFLSQGQTMESNAYGNFILDYLANSSRQEKYMINTRRIKVRVNKLEGKDTRTTESEETQVLCTFIQDVFIDWFR